MSDDTAILPGLSPVCGLDVHAKFDGGTMTSNGGALLLREARRGLDLAKVLAGCIRDGRDPTKVIHSYASMIDAFCDSFPRPPRQIVLDIDDNEPCRAIGPSDNGE